MNLNISNSKATELFKKFTESEKSGGIILISCTLISLAVANSIFGDDYNRFWETPLGGHSLTHWINDGLMAIFFLLIGLELEREIILGELSKLKDALLPMFGAIGGMLVPAGLFLVFNYGTPTQSGLGIPMATDIAFALGFLALLGKRVPLSLKIFLTALAVMDDLGAILVIAIFYTKTLLWSNLFIAMGIWLCLWTMGRLGLRNIIPYLAGGVAMWYFMLNSGVHATITGVLLAFAIPFGKGDKASTSYILQNALHIPVAFIILPLFALANTAIVLSGDLVESLSQNYSLGIAAGLIVGKPLGILLMSYLIVALGYSKLPKNLDWKAILGVGFLAGIGFTMSIFIALLAFGDPTVINNSKFVIMVSSLIAGAIGLLYLRFVLKSPEKMVVKTL